MLEAAETMKKATFVLLLLIAVPAKADPAPAYMLDKEYETCMSGPTQGLDQQKKNYCLCVRNRMASWDLDTFAQVAQSAKNSSAVPAVLEDLAKACIAQTLK